jgi:NADH-quinone oxidoreductase subunit H
MMIDLGIIAAKAFLVLFMVLNLAGVLGWIERKGSALIQDRIGANRASIFGFAGMGLINTLIADPIKFLTKEDFIPPRGDRFLHTLAPCLALFPALVTFAVIPFGDVLTIAGREIALQVANLNIGILYIFAMASLSVYGIVIGAWASNNKFSLLGGVRGAAQMVSYEIAMGLSVLGVIMIFGTLELQEIVRAQGGLLQDRLPPWMAFLKSSIGWLPAWGIFLQPVAFLLFFTAAVAETKRIPFDLPEGEAELVAGYHVEYSGAKFLMFFTGEFAEIVTAGALVTTLFFGGWQVPYLMRDGFHLPWGDTLLLPHLAVVLLQVGAFAVKVVFFCWVQILLRWSLPRFRYDQVMRLGWKMLLPVALVNVIVTAVWIVLGERVSLRP